MTCWSAKEVKGDPVMIITPPDLTQWIPLLGWATLGVYGVYKAFKKGRRSEQDEQAAAVEKAVAPVRTIAAEAQALASVRAERIEELEREVRRVEGERDKAIEERDGMIQSVLRAEADIKKLKKSVARLEGREH